MNGLSIRPLERKHIERFFNTELEQDFEFVGYAGYYDRLLAMFGGLFLRDDNWWFAFSFRPGTRRPPKIHRYAIKLLQSAKISGITTIYAAIDEDVSTSERWLGRMGFVETEPKQEFDHILKGGRLFVWQTHLHS